MNLEELESRLAEIRRLGATGQEPIIIEGIVATGIDGLKISTVCSARNAALCQPASLGLGPIVRIWGVPGSRKERR